MADDSLAAALEEAEVAMTAETLESQVVAPEITVVSANPPARRVIVSGYELYLNDEDRLNVPATLGPQTCLVDSSGTIVPLGPTGYTDLPLAPGQHYQAKDLRALREEMKQEREATESIWNIFAGDETGEPEPEPEEETKKPVPLIWTKIEPTGQLPLPRYNHTTVAVGERLFVFGGQVEGSTSNLLFVLDTETNAWSRVETTGAVPAPRFGHSAVALGDSIVVCGGVVRKQPTAEIFFLDTATMNWSKPAVTGDVPAGRYGHTATLVGNSMHIIGGVDAGDEYLADTYTFDVATSQWVCPDIGGAVPEGLAWHTAAVVGGDRIVVFGGKRRMFAFVDEYIEDVFILDLKTLECMGPAIYIDSDTINGRAQHTCVAVSPTQLLVYGGETRWGDDISVIMLDLGKKEWVRPVISGQWPEARHGHTATLIGSEMIVFGGMAEGWSVANVHSLSFTALIGNDAAIADDMGVTALPSVEGGGGDLPADGVVVVAQKMEEHEVPE